MGHWRHGIEEEGVHQWLAVVAAPREALVEGGANEREEKQREHGEGVAEPCVGAVGRAVRALRAFRASWPSPACQAG